MKSYVIDVQRCSIHDGPGIRTTVFLKGCPLKCKWCHNPESQCFEQELSFNQSRCTSCGLCQTVCTNNVHSIVNGVHTVDYSQCLHCEHCVEVCPTKALSIIGKDMTPQEVFDIVKKDEIFYAQGNGGITISGGEALSHIEFCLNLLKLCKEKGYHTCIETSGFATRNAVEKVLPYVDLFLYDFKVSNEQDALKYIGCSLESIKSNFKYIYKQGKDIVLRCPIIPQVNDTKEHFNAIGEMTLNYPNLIGAELLPYHNFGTSKAENIGKEVNYFTPPTDTQKQEWIEYFNKNGYNKVKFS